MALKSLWLVSVCCYADYCDATNSTLWDFCAKAVTDREIWLIGQHSIHNCYPKQNYVTLPVSYRCAGGEMLFFSIWHASLSSENLSEAGWAVVGCLSLGIHQSAGWCHANIPHLSSLQDTTKCHSLRPHLPETFPAIWAFLPRMHSTVINNGFDLNWLFWSLKCL